MTPLIPALALVYVLAVALLALVAWDEAPVEQPRRHAFLVRTTPLRTFRVRSASRGPARLVVEQPDGSLRCNCPAADFRSECAHRRLVARSIERRDRRAAA